MRNIKSNKLLKFGILSLLLFPLFGARADSSIENAVSAPAHLNEAWEADYAAIRTWPSSYRLRAGKKWTGPMTEFVRSLTAHRALIIKAARIYGVDPRAIVGAILSENSMNNKEYVSRQVNGAEDLFSAMLGGTVHDVKDFSFGYGQIKMGAAMPVEEQLCWLVENRAEKSEGAVRSDIREHPAASIRYVAAILRTAQDAYMKVGIDIRKNIPVLVTLFNLGKYDEKAAEAAKAMQKDANFAPRPNFTGIFAKHYLESTIEQIVGSPVAAKVPQGPRYFVSHIALRSALDTCFHPSIKVSGKGEKGTALIVLAQDYDCALSPWYLVRTATNNLGWMSKSDFDNFTSSGEAPIQLQQDVVENCDPNSIKKNFSQFSKIKTWERPTVLEDVARDFDVAVSPYVESKGAQAPNARVTKKFKDVIAGLLQKSVGMPYSQKYLKSMEAAYSAQKYTRFEIATKSYELERVLLGRSGLVKYYSAQPEKRIPLFTLPGRSLGTDTDAKRVNFPKDIEAQDKAFLEELVMAVPLNASNNTIHFDEVRHLGPTAEELKKLFGTCIQSIAVPDLASYALLDGLNLGIQLVYQPRNETEVLYLNLKRQ